MNPEVTVYSRRGCHLCEAAEAIIREVNREIPFDLKVIYVDGDSTLEKEYGEEVPVTLINGKRHDFFKVDRERLIVRIREVSAR